MRHFREVVPHHVDARVRFGLPAKAKAALMKVREAESIEDLLGAIQAANALAKSSGDDGLASALEELVAGDLRTFGGGPPDDDRQALSWDKKFLLVLAGETIDDLQLSYRRPDDGPMVEPDEWDIEMFESARNSRVVRGAELKRRLRAMGLEAE